MKRFKPYNPKQEITLPSSPREWLPEGHVVYFICDVVENLDLGEIYRAYRAGDDRGQPPYDPGMMVRLLFYGYCMGKVSSRKLEKATYEEVPYRILAQNQHPDHDSIAQFRKRHLHALSRLFFQVLEICQQAGLAKVGYVALDGTKVKANASKHKAMSYGRMCEAEKKLQEEIERLLDEAQKADAAEEQGAGAEGRREDKLPMELQRRESRLKKIREAKQALEEQARQEAREKAEQQQQKIEERRRKEEETGKKAGGRKPKDIDPEQARPEAKAQRNFTDSDSRIMPIGGGKQFVQGYNAQAAVNENQIIMACDVSQETNDKQQLVPMMGKVKENTGETPEKGIADSGYFSEAQVSHESLKGVDLYVATDRQKHSQSSGLEADGESSTDGEVQPESNTEPTAIEKMREKLKTAVGRAVYALRKSIVEPVFGQIKGERGFERFSFRGLENVDAEWAIICLTHNLLKLFRSGYVFGASA